MEISKIIKALKMCCDAGVEQTPELLCEAANALEKLNCAVPKNKPLTLDELRKICKERAPVWIAEKGNPNYGGYWQYAYDSSSGTMAFFTFGNEVEELYDTKNYGKTRLAYASKPKGEQD